MNDKNILSYKGYNTRIDYDKEEMKLFGKIEGINDLVFFSSDSTTKIEDEFHQAVDEYLELCEINNVEPDKVYKGLFNVRIQPELHKRLSLYACLNEISLNAAVEQSIEYFLDYKPKAIIDKFSKTFSDTIELMNAVSYKETSSKEQETLSYISDVNNIKYNFHGEGDAS